MLKSGDKMKKLLVGTLLSLLVLAACTNKNSSVKHDIAISSDSERIAYNTYGAGETSLIFIHGWSCDSRYWQKQLSTFSKHYQVITIDLAGHGNSSLGRLDYTMLSFANDVKAVIEKAGIPAAWTILGASALPTSHPLNIGMVGMHGNYAPNRLTNECDVLIAIGMRFDDRVTGNLATYAKQAKVIHFEIDPAEVDKNVKTDVAVLGDSKESLAKLLPLLNPNSHTEWLQKFKDLYAIEFEKVIKNDLHPTKEGLTMGEVLNEINKQSKGQTAIVTDVGKHQMIA